MKNEFLQYFMDERNKTGLLIAEAPTGYGKTYETVQAIYHYIRSGGTKRVLFVTNLIKNLPKEDLREAYRADGKEFLFDKEVFVLRSPVDTIRESIGQFPIPREFQTESYEELKNAFQELEKYQKVAAETRKVLEDQCLKRIREDLEPKFRHEIMRMLYKTFGKNISQKKKAIRLEHRYHWISQFYPSVFWDEYKIILLTVQKLMVQNVSLVEPSFPCLSERMIQNSIICIDEFDASRADILKHLIDNALKLKADYLELFRQIHNRAKEHQPSRQLIDARERYEKGHSRTWEMLMKEADEIYTYGALSYSLKTAKDSIDSGRNFLFHDTSYHTILDQNRTHIRTICDEQRQQVRVNFETKEVYDMHKDADPLQLQTLLRRIQSFLQRFRYFIYGWADALTHLENESRAREEDLYTADMAIDSILFDFGMTKEQIQLLKGDLNSTQRTKQNNHLIAPDLSFYETGFRLFEFIDDDHHSTRTDLQYVQMQSTPEKILLYLCKRAKVIGLSATAAMPTVTGNYDLKYLREQLGTQFHELSATTREHIKNELEAQWQPYADGRIKVQLSIVDQNQDQFELEERLETIFANRGLAIKYANQLPKNDYQQKRYCNLFSVIRSFLENPDIKSCLCLHWVLPAYHKESFNLTIIEDALEDLKKVVAPGSRGEIAVLRSGSDFDNTKAEVLKNLSDGEKYLILSSYQTLGAGQNLQYPVRHKIGLITLGKDAAEDDARFSQKDMDALYLGDITHTAVNLYGDEQFSSESLMKFCFQVECLYQNNEISRRTLDALLKDGLSRYAGYSKENSASRTALKNARSIHREITRNIIQAVGRINRTFLKRPTVYLFTTEKVLRDMEPDCLEGKLLTPEMQALADARANIVTRYEPLNEKRNEMEQKATRGNNYIQRMLNTPWTQNNMEMWKELRRLVLCHPRASQKMWESDPVIRAFYISIDEDQRKYYYTQKGDFAAVSLSMGQSRSEFIANLSENMATSEVSEDEARLQIILKYPGMKEFFQENGYAVEFGNGPYIMSPVLFQNIYKGALGEVAGAFILKQELGMDLREITDPAKFETFDFELNNGIYVDFKHWKKNTWFEQMRMRKKIQSKLDQINGNRAIIINMVSDGESNESLSSDTKVIEIPGIIGTDGKPNRKVLRALREMIV